MWKLGKLAKHSLAVAKAYLQYYVTISEKRDIVMQKLKLV